jgi:hypothetical protein
MSTIMGLDYLYLMESVIDSTGKTDYVVGVNPAKIKAALGLEVTQLEVDSTQSADTNYPYKYLIHYANNNNDGIVIRVYKGKNGIIVSPYVNGVLNYSESILNIASISSTSQLVMYYKKSDDYVVTGFARTTDNVRLQVAFINYSNVGDTEKQKCILFSRNVSSELYKYILPGGIYNSASNKNSSISNDIVALYPLIDVTGRIVIYKAYISAINKSILDTFYFVVDGKAYISLISGNASANKVCIRIN